MRKKLERNRFQKFKKYVMERATPISLAVGTVGTLTHPEIATTTVPAMLILSGAELAYLRQKHKKLGRLI